MHLTGGSKTAKLSDIDEARRLFALDFPEEPIGEIWLTRSWETAFLSVGKGRVGIIHGIGSHFLMRIICAADVAHASCEGNVLLLRFRDFSWRGGKFEFANASEPRAVLDALHDARKADQWEAA